MSECRDHMVNDAPDIIATFPYPYGSDVNERPYVQTLLKLAVILYESMGQCKLNKNIRPPGMDDAGNKIVPVFNGLSRLYTGLGMHRTAH